MPTNFRTFTNGIRVEPQTADQTSRAGEIDFQTSDAKFYAHDGTAASPVVTESSTATLTNKTLTSPVINTPTGITKADVGLSNVDNTSDATKNAATATLTNKTINGSNNTISNVSLTTSVTGTLPISNGGTGQTTQQAAMNALAGAQSAGNYLRSDGTNTTLSNIQAGDVPTLNQNTTGSAASFTGSLSGDVTGTQGATVVSQVGGVSASNVASGANAANAATSAPTASKIVVRDANGNAQINNLAEGFTTTATSGGTTTLTVASTYVQQFTGTSNQTVVLPVTSTLAVGQAFMITNRSTGTLTVNSSGGNLVQTMASGTQLIVTCSLASGTTATSWDAAYSSTSSLTNPMTAVGDLIIGGASGVATRLPIGSTGNVPTVSGGTIVWAPAGTASPLTTKGDLYGFDTGNNRIPVGGNNKVLVADSSGSLGLTYAYPNGKNYVSNPGFESNTTTCWSLFNTTLTSGIPTGSISAGASSITSFGIASGTSLGGAYSLSVTAASGLTAGQGFISDAFTIDNEDQAKVLTEKFYYSVVNGTFNLSGTSSNTYAVYLYDVTNSAWIQPAGVYGMTQGTGVGLCTGTFQTTSNSTQYRIAVLCINSTTGLTSMLFDDFSVGPQTVPIGYAGGDWVAYTPTFTNFGTVSGVSVYSRRVGDSLEIRGTFTSGTTVAATGSISLGYNGVNGNVTTDINKIPANNGGIYSLVGEAANSATSHSFTVIAQGNDSVLKLGIADLSSGLSPVNGSSFLGNTQIGSFFARVPIVGWSSNVQMSSDTDTRVVAARYYISTNNTPGTGQVNFDSKVFDTHAAVTTGSGWKFTAPISGYYQVTLQQLTTTAGAGSTHLFKNGVSNATLSSFLSTNGQGSATIQLNAGDYIDIRPNTTGYTFDSSGGADYNVVCIQRLSGPAVIAATESVNAQVRLTTNQTTSAIIKFDTVLSDTHGSYSTATGLYTCAVSGRFRVNATLNGNATYTPYVGKNGTAYASLSTTTSTTISNGSTTVKCNAGDTLGVYSNGVSVTVTGDAGTPSQAIMCIERVGN